MAVLLTALLPVQINSSTQPEAFDSSRGGGGGLEAEDSQRRRDHTGNHQICLVAPRLSQTAVSTSVPRVPGFQMQHSPQNCTAVKCTTFSQITTWTEKIFLLFGVWHTQIQEPHNSFFSAHQFRRSAPCVSKLESSMRSENLDLISAQETGSENRGSVR